MQTKNNKIPSPDSQTTACCTEFAQLFEPTLFKALADPSRVAILAMLAISCGAQTVSKVAEAFDLNFSVVSRHLKTLKDAGILSAHKDGKEVRYHVNARQLVSALRKMATALEQCCPESTQCNDEESL